MAQKVIDVVGTSKESLAKAAENAVAEAAIPAVNMPFRVFCYSCIPIEKEKK